ncbi:MAG TPA: sensor histidine kinase, partial [Alphaproteobacteria bacterium]|nr:sensor histidine kinase [Alphaproteobacteria bacterium]
ELELRSAYEALEEIKRGLDETVAERTAALRGSLARNEMLLREVHHRVKNNLQLVSSLVGAASRSEPDARSRMKFVEVQAQIRAIAATYDVLLRMDSVDVADYCKIVSELCRHIQAAHPGLVSISTEGAGNAPVSADAAVALSLAINELITNSMKHAAPGREINIAVSCKVAGERLRIGIADDGTGFGPGFDLERAKGFGLQMARMFIEHAGGQIHVVERAMGAAVEISVPTVGTA